MKLDDIPKDKSGFQVPDAYFELMDQRLWRSIQIDVGKDMPRSEELEELLQASKETWEIPNGYFEKNEQLVVPTKPKKVIGLRLYAYATAAALALLVAGTSILWWKNQTAQHESFAQQIETTDLTEEDLLEEIEEEVLFEVYNEELEALVDTLKPDTVQTKNIKNNFIPKPGEKVNWNDLTDDDFLYFINEVDFDEEDL